MYFNERMVLFEACDTIWHANIKRVAKNWQGTGTV